MFRQLDELTENPTEFYKYRRNINKYNIGTRKLYKCNVIPHAIRKLTILPSKEKKRNSVGSSNNTIYIIPRVYSVQRPKPFKDR